MKHFTLFKPLLMAVALLVGGVNYVWAAGYTRTLTNELSVSGYKAKAFYNFQNNTPEVLPTDGELRYRDGGVWGLQNFGSGSRSAVATISVASGDILIIQEYSPNLTSINRGSKNETLSTSTGYTVFDVTTTADNITFTVGRYGGIVAAFVMEIDKDVATATYTINYKDGESIVKTSSNTVAVGTVIPIESTFWVSTTKYIKDGGEPSSLTVAAGGSTLNVSVSEAPIYSYTVNATVGGSTVKELASGSIYSGETATVPYPLYVNVGGTLYQKSANSSQYRQNIVVTSDNQVTEFAYTETDITNVVYFSEGEEVTGATATAEGSNMSIRSSNAKCGYAGSDINLVALPASQYTATMVIYSNSSGGATISFDFDTDYDEVITGSSNWALRTHDFTLSEGKTIKWNTSGDSKNGLDFIYIVDKTAKEVAEAIADCKQYETSAAFATAVAGATFANAAEVYAFHTAWQIEQADAASSNDITNVIRNSKVADGTDWNNARLNYNQQYTGAPDNTYFDAYDKDASNASQTIYGLPAGTYTLKVATRASETLTDIDKYNIWVNGGTADEKVLGHHEGNEGNFLGNGWNWTVISFTLDADADVNIGFYSLPGNGSGLWAGCDDWHLYKGQLTYPLTIGISGWATLYTPYALDFSSLSGSFKAYTATVEGSTVTLTEVSNVPANTGVVLKGTADSYNVPVIASSSTGKGDLTGNATEATAWNAETGYDLYMLALNGENKAQFTKVSEGSIAAGKAFLKVSNGGGGSIKSFNVVFNDTATGISSIDNGQLTVDNGQIFNLAGQRVSQPTRGLYIVNGKKVIK